MHKIHYCQDCGCILQPEYIPIGLCSSCLDVTMEDENSVEDHGEIDQQSFFPMNFDEDEDY